MVIEMEVSIQNADDLLYEMDYIASEEIWTQANKAGVRAYARQLVKHLKNHAPVRTGLLQASFGKLSEGGGQLMDTFYVKVGSRPWFNRSHIDYWLEHGKKGQDPQPFHDRAEAAAELEGQAAYNAALIAKILFKTGAFEDEEGDL